MKNKNFNFLLIFFLIILINSQANSNEQFNFDVTNVEILENGKIFKGLNKGIATSNNGIVINADSFEYNKETNILIAKDNVKMEDTIENYTIFSDQVTYFKNDEKILTKGNSKASYINGQLINADSFEYNKETNILIAKDNVKMEDTIENYTIFSDQVTYFKNDEKILTKGNSKASYINGQLINADSFEYNKETNILIAKDNVKMEDTIENYTIFSDQVTYFKNDEKILTKGKTKSLINNKYEIQSKNVLFLINKNLLSSKERTTIKDKNSNFYQLDEFELLKEKDELRGNKILAISNFGSSKSDKLYFSSAIIDLNTKNYLAKDTKIKIHKEIFNNPKNDPRLLGVSSNKNGDITIVNKGIFTSCGNSDKCPPWSIKAEKIKHDRKKKQLIYKNAFLKIYDIPVLYFPKFFHPDPTVKRQSGFLQPKLGDSDILGSSATIPYFYAKNESTDFTFTPTIFDKNTKMLQTEFRKVGNNYNFISDFGFINNYKSSIDNKKKNISHFLENLIKILN
jgi:LPS-assembly protein